MWLGFRNAWFSQRTWRSPLMRSPLMGNGWWLVVVVVVPSGQLLLFRLRYTRNGFRVLRELPQYYHFNGVRMYVSVEQTEGVCRRRFEVNHLPVRCTATSARAVSFDDVILPASVSTHTVGWRLCRLDEPVFFVLGSSLPRVLCLSPPRPEIARRVRIGQASRLPGCVHKQLVEVLGHKDDRHQRQHQQQHAHFAESPGLHQPDKYSRRRLWRRHWWCGHWE